MSAILKRSIVVGNHKTSVSLEPEFFDALKEIARKRDATLSQVVTMVDGECGREGNLSSAIRVFVLAELQNTICMLENEAALMLELPCAAPKAGQVAA